MAIDFWWKKDTDRGLHTPSSASFKSGVKDACTTSIVAVATAAIFKPDAVAVTPPVTTALTRLLLLLLTSLLLLMQLFQLGLLLAQTGLRLQLKLL